MHDSVGKTVPLVGAVTKWLIGGSSATAEEDRFFILNDPPLGIYHPEVSADFQRTAFIHFKESFYILHRNPGLICKTYLPVCAVTIGHAF